MMNGFEDSFRNLACKNANTVCHVAGEDVPAVYFSDMVHVRARFSWLQFGNIRNLASIERFS